MVKDTELQAYIDEISVILKTCTDEAILYAKYRAIGENFNQNTNWLSSTPPPSISFFNGLGAMLDLSLVMSTWKIMECPAQAFKGPGGIDGENAPFKRRKHDEIRSLPRLAWLFRQAFGAGYENYAVRYKQRQDEIIQQHNLPARNMEDYQDAMQRALDRLLVLCSNIDTFVASENYKKLDIVRNQGFAHSAAISRKFISSGMDDDFDFARSTLFGLGDSAMQIALDFETLWNQRARPSIQNLIEKNIATSSTFWADIKRGLTL